MTAKNTPGPLRKPAPHGMDGPPFGYRRGSACHAILNGLRRSKPGRLTAGFARGVNLASGCSGLACHKRVSAGPRAFLTTPVHL